MSGPFGPSGSYLPTASTPHPSIRTVIIESHRASTGGAFSRIPAAGPCHRSASYLYIYAAAEKGQIIFQVIETARGLAGRKK